ncbi:MAG: hypothetical protein AB4290_00640 [Spirulina sp.]
MMEMGEDRRSQGMEWGKRSHAIAWEMVGLRKIPPFRNASKPGCHLLSHGGCRWHEKPWNGCWRRKGGFMSKVRHIGAFCLIFSLRLSSVTTFGGVGCDTAKATLCERVCSWLRGFSIPFSVRVGCVTLSLTHHTGPFQLI